MGCKYVPRCNELHDRMGDLCSQPPLSLENGDVDYGYTGCATYSILEAKALYKMEQLMREHDW